MATAESESESESKPNDHAKKNITEKSISKSCEVSSILLLQEDLIIDIFRRVSINCLLNSVRYVCKPWATTIGSSHFAKVQHAHSKPGIYVQNYQLVTSYYYFLDIKDDLSGHSERIDLEIPSKLGFLMSTCDGILLTYNRSRDIFVVNPILKRYLRVPTLVLAIPKILISITNYTIARVPHSAIFKLFAVTTPLISGAKWYVFYVLKIGIDNSWKEIARKKVIDESDDFSHVVYPPSFYSGGDNLYWITWREVIVMNVDKEVIVGEYPFPIPLFEDLRLCKNFLWMENHFSCIVHKDPTKTFQIYILDIDSRKWTFYHEIGPFDYEAVCGDDIKIVSVNIRFWMYGKFIFQLCLYQSKNGVRRIHFGYNLKTKQLTKIECISDGDYYVLLHTNSLALLSSNPRESYIS